MLCVLFLSVIIICLYISEIKYLSIYLKVDQHRESYDETNYRDFIDMYLSEEQKDDKIGQ